MCEHLHVVCGKMVYDGEKIFMSSARLHPVLYFIEDVLNDFGQTASLYLSLFVKLKAYEHNDEMVIEVFLQYENHEFE